VRQRLINTEKIGKIIDEGEEKDKKENSPPEVECCQYNGRQKYREKYYLERHNQGNIF